jgi:hypothetical protein
MQSFHFAKELWEKRESINSPQKATAATPTRKSNTSLLHLQDDNDRLTVPSLLMQSAVPPLAKNNLIDNPTNKNEMVVQLYNKQKKKQENSVDAQCSSNQKNNNKKKMTFMAANTSKNKPPPPSSSSSVSLPPNKSVCFGDVTTHEIENLHELQQQKHQDDDDTTIADLIWWSAREYTEIKKEYETVLYLMETGQPVCEHEYSIRGLENRTEAGAWKLFEHQRNARNAVLIEQDQQRKKKNKNNKQFDSCYHDTIAKVYIHQVQTTRQQAIEQAAKDAAEVKEFYQQQQPQQKSDTEEMTNNNHHESNSFDIEIGSLILPCSTTTQSPTKKKNENTKFTGRAKDAFEIFCNSSVDFAKSKFGKKSHHPYHSKTVSSVSWNSNENVPKHLHLISPTQTTTTTTTTNTEQQRDPQTTAVVRFDPTVQFIPTTQKRVTDVIRDKHRRWLSTVDLKIIETSFSQTIEKMEKGIAISEEEQQEEESDEETKRGLEKSTEEGSWKLYERRRDAMDVVLVLQDQQRKQQPQGLRLLDQNEKEIAKAYRDATKEARREALRFGKADAKEAKKYRLRVKTSDAAQSSLLVPKRSISSESIGDDVSRDSCDDYSKDSGDEMDGYFFSKREKKRRNNKNNMFSSVPDPSESTLNRMATEDRCNNEDVTEYDDSTHHDAGDMDDRPAARSSRSEDIPLHNSHPMPRPKLRRRLSKSHATSKRSIFNESEPEKTLAKATRTEPENFVWSRNKRDQDHSESAASVYEDLGTCITEIVCTPEQLNGPTDLEIQNVNHVFANIDCDCENDEVPVSQETKVASCSNNITSERSPWDQDIKKGNFQENQKNDCLPPPVYASSDGNVSRMKVEYLKQLIEGKFYLKATPGNIKTTQAKEKINVANGNDSIRSIKNDSCSNEIGIDNLARPNVSSANSSERIVSSNGQDTLPIDPDTLKTDIEGSSRNTITTLVEVPNPYELTLGSTTTTTTTTTRTKTEDASRMFHDKFAPNQLTKSSADTISNIHYSSENVIDFERKRSNEESKRIDSEMATVVSPPSGSADDNDKSTTQQGNETMVWFKVKRNDVVKIDIGDGRVIYILDSAEAVSDGDARLLK